MKGMNNISSINQKWVREPTPDSRAHAHHGQHHRRHYLRSRHLYRTFVNRGLDEAVQETNKIIKNE